MPNTFSSGGKPIVKKKKKKTSKMMGGPKQNFLASGFGEVKRGPEPGEKINPSKVKKNKESIKDFMKRRNKGGEW